MSVDQGKSTGADYYGPANITLAIFLVSVLGLFLEMLLIRWISTEIRIFAYLQNTILVVCFLGLGIGCFTSKKPVALRKLLLIPLFFLILLIAIPQTKEVLGNISQMLSNLGDLVIWHSVIVSNLWEALFYLIAGLLLTFLLMVLIVDIFIPLGRLLGRLIDAHPQTIWAYSVNVAGSLIGTWLFVLLSVLHQPPVIWLIVMAFFLFFFLEWGNKGKIDFALLLGIIIFSWLASQENSLEILWSPYQKLVLKESSCQKKEAGKFNLTVNNTNYQALLDLSEKNVKSHPNKFSSEMMGLSQYDIPLILHPRPQSFLVVGAGSGNDAAAGIRHNIKKITAVEIDPAIISLGRRYHPEKPYDSPTVQVVNDDARSFFATCQGKYDVISFGLLDSHTTTAMTNARLDHYVYTRESLERAKSLLAPGGIIVLSFEAQKPFIADRMASILSEVFQEYPLCFCIPYSNYGWGGVIFIAGDLITVRKQIDNNKRFAALIEKWQNTKPVPLTYTTKVTTDDWPYIYLQTPTIPILYYLLAGMMFLLLIRCGKYFSLKQLFSEWRLSHWHFFFLGAAFLLLEVQNISKAAVALGNTWEVNAVIVSGVLVMILVANFLAAIFPKLPLKVTYVALILSCLTLYFLDLSRFAFLPYFSKVVVVGGLTTLPIVFSGIVFIRSFAVVVGKDTALGANLIGALVGAMLQSVTFITGIKALLLFVAGLYFLSMLTQPPTLLKQPFPKGEPTPQIT
ncbi:methyltransferase type 12 [Desulfobacca acetoxidans]|uniref:Methyltransferase type 12 n=1 Tax=Desulfobacca acetoxidans (strain ATCC 700848 / DSM 11109 / ASRB2) TaxID=880072 RepID=F2NHW8_DESAR|nr:methyltransferase type 12 [Desulfobacca acetoxidans]AEB09453.1 Methyltransferase type 12 [Desulfobacca acetoxidans DSM 11109]